MDTQKLFGKVLDLFDNSDWSQFEKLCSVFLSSDFNNIRTLASPSGDGGVDSELFFEESNPNSIFQYSVAKDWKTKIKTTKERIKVTHPDRKFIIYLTNQKIGASSDGLKKELLSEGYMLDVRDKNWFLDKVFYSEATLRKANELIDIYLQRKSDVNINNHRFENKELFTAIHFLGLQFEDAQHDRNLTKLSFEALVRAALRKSSSQNRYSREKIHEYIYEILGGTAKNNIDELIDNALNRLKRTVIKHWQKEDSFCLSFDEQKRLEENLSEKQNIEIQIKELIKDIIKQDEKIKSKDYDRFCDFILSVIYSFLYEKGLEFVSALSQNLMTTEEERSIKYIIANEVAKNNFYIENIDVIEKIYTVIKIILNNHDENDTINKYLRYLSNSYILYLFLNKTESIKTLTSKLFTKGNIWIDTTVLLPLLSEKFLSEDMQRMTQIFKHCTKAGINLYTTLGVIEEICTHLQNCVVCALKSDWRGKPPFLYEEYLSMGLHPKDFPEKIQEICGSSRPIDDIILYLQEIFSIEIKEFDDDNKLPENLYNEICSIWEDGHK